MNKRIFIAAMVLKKAVMVAAFALVASPANAAITIGALTQLCSYGPNGKEIAPSAHASCQSYIAGILDYHDLYKSVGKSGANVDFCLPPALTYADIQRVVLEYLQRSASFQDSLSAPAVVLGLREEFPCDGFAPAAGGAGTQDLLAPDPLAGNVPTDDVLNTPAQ